jgi:glycerophosphoryl diester phosphodiesterase
MSNPKQTLNIAHRGARSLAPENTLSAARKGFEIGADLWELDVAMTKDGELVLIHDDSFERTSNVGTLYPDRKKAGAHEFTLAELRKLDLGSWFNQTDPFKQIAAGAISKAELDKFVGEPVPTLREALQYTRDQNWRVNVEIKDASGTPPDPVIVEKVVALIKELDMVERVMISSFNHSYIQRVKAAENRIITAALVERADPDPVALLKRLGAQAYNPSSRVITPGAIRPIREAGFDVFIWTVNDELAMKTLIDAGASGIITDFPQLLKEVLKKTP